jgi:hypothetical protein
LPPFDREPTTYVRDVAEKYPVPKGVADEHLWRYSSAGEALLRPTGIVWGASPHVAVFLVSVWHTTVVMRAM